MRALLPTLLLLLATLTYTPSRTVQATYLSSANQDLLSAFSWAALDLPQAGVDLLSPSEGLALTGEENNMAARPRKRRQLFPDKEIMPIFVEVEIRFIIPMFQVFESDNLNFEVPFTYEMDWPEILRRSGSSEGAAQWQETVGGMVKDFEDMISMFGINGHGCVRRALCEMGSLPPIRPQGIVGEMLDIFVRNIGNGTALLSQKHSHLNNTQIYDEEEEEVEVEEEEGLEEELEELEGEIDVTNNNNNNTSEEQQEQEQEQVERKEKEEEEEEEVEISTSKPTKKEKRRKVGKGGRKRTRREMEEGEENKITMDYLTAGTFGKLAGDCAAAFSECPVSFLENSGPM